MRKQAFLEALFSSWVRLVEESLQGRNVWSRGMCKRPRSGGGGRDGEDWDGVAEGHLGSGGRRGASLVDPCSFLEGPEVILEVLRC